MSHEDTISIQAERYIKDHSRELIEHFADPDSYTPADHPVSVFMAGSQGAGKTEFSKRLAERLSEQRPVRIDADEIREIIPGYEGKNAHIFQKACTIGVHKLLDHVIKKDLNFILDGTFAYAHAKKNIERCLNHHRSVIIYYVFQDPLTAWKFTQAREAVEGRRVLPETFIHAFLNARQNVEEVKKSFRNQVQVHLIIKDFVSEQDVIFTDIEELDSLLPKRYSRHELEQLL